MRTIVLITCYLFGLFLLPSCERNEMSDLVKTWGHIENVEVYSPSLEGNLLGDPAERGVNVYLPKSYYTNPDKRFPVIYYLHGLPASEHSLINPEMIRFALDYPQRQFISWINGLIDYGGMKEAIVVMPNAANHYAISFYTNNQVQGNYEDYIVDDLVLYMDMNFRTIPHSNYRAITGHSAGGYGALRIAMRHPDVFQYVAGLSPVLFTQEFVMAMAECMIYEDTAHIISDLGIEVPWWGFKGPSDYSPWTSFKFANNYLYSGAVAWLPNSKNPPYYVDIPFTYNGDGQVVMNDELIEKWTSESIFNLVLNNSNGLKELKSIYFDCGESDEFMINFFDLENYYEYMSNSDRVTMYSSNRALHEMLDELNIIHCFESYQGTHYSNLYERLGKVLVDLSNDFPENE